MPMPHRTQMQLIKRRLVGKEGSERTRELRAILAELPNYKNGPYADIRKWVNSQIVETRARGRVAQPRLDRRAPGGRGADRARRPAERGQVVAAAGALVDPDQDRRLRVHDDAAGTRADADRGRARPARRDPGADRGRERGPRRRPRAARRAARRRRDRLLPRLRIAARPSSRRCAPRSRRPGSRSRRSSRRRRPTTAMPPAHPDLDVVPVSVLDDESLDRFRAAVWRLTGLVRVYLRDGGDPVALYPPVTVEDVAHSIHHELGERCTGARVWGPSARFAGPAGGEDARARGRRRGRDPRPVRTRIAAWPR